MSNNYFFSLRFQRVITRVLLPFFILWVCAIPRQANAAGIGALGVLGTPLAGGTGGISLLGADALGLLIIGMGLGYLGVGAACDASVICSDATKPSYRLPLTDGNPVPAPYAPPTTVPEGNTCIKVGSTVDMGHCAETGNDVVAARQTLCEGLGGNFFVATMVCQLWPAPTANYNGGVINCPVYCNATFQENTACVDGYTLNGTVCELTDPRLASPDNNCDVTRSGGAIAIMNDPDCVGGRLPMICDAGATHCTITGTDSHGNPASIEIGIVGGGSTITVNNQGVSGGQTQVQTTTINVDSSGVVTGFSGDLSAGSIDSATGQAVTSGNAITFPSDYARTGEAAQAAQTLAPKLDILHTDLTAGAVPVSDPVTPMNDRVTQVGTAPEQPSINWIPSILPGTASACRAMPIDGAVHGGLLNGFTGTASFDICDKLDLVRQILGYLFFVGTVVFIYRRFTRSNSTAEG